MALPCLFQVLSKINNSDLLSFCILLVFLTMFLMFVATKVVQHDLKWMLAAGQYNDLATAYLALPNETIRRILSLGIDSPKEPSR